ncbi:ATPase with role in protein import into the ER, partial [Linnemannia elongata]
VLESASPSSRSLHPQGAQPSSKRSSKSKKAAAALKEKEKAAAAAAAAAAANSSITSRWIRRPQSVVVESEGSSDSEKDSDDSDSDSDSDSEAEQSKTKKTYKNKPVSSSASSSSSAFSSGSSSCSSTAGSGAENDSDSDNETVELNHETLRPSATSRSGFSHNDTSKLPPPPPYSEQVREKIDMFMALKGAASLLVDVGPSYTTAAYSTEDGECIFVRNEHGDTKIPNIIVSFPSNDNTTIFTTMVRHMKELAEAQIGNDTKITNVMPVIPGEFDDDQRVAVAQAVRAVGEMGKEGEKKANLNVLRIVSRHKAAAMAYGLDNEFIYEGKGIREPEVRELMVVDLEETRFDVGLWEIDSGVYEMMGLLERQGGGGFGEEAADRAAEIQQRRKAILSDEILTGRLRREVTKMNNVFLAASLHVQPVADTTVDISSHHTVRIEIDSFFDGRDLSLSLNLSQWQDLRSRSLTLILDTIDEVLEKFEVMDEGG